MSHSLSQLNKENVNFIFRHKWKIKLVIGVISVFALFWILSKQFFSSVESKNYGRVYRTDIVQSVTISGNITPKRGTYITAPYRGYVKKLFVKVGDKVKKGEPVVSVVSSLQTTEDVYPLRAPYDGVVVILGKSEGEGVSEADMKDYIMRLDDMSQIYVLGLVPELHRSKIKIDQKAVIKVTALSDQTFTGHIVEMSLAAFSKEDWRKIIEFPIRIEIDNPINDIRSGLSVLADIMIEKKDNVLALGPEYILSENQKYYVILKNNEKKEIKIGLQTDDKTEIVSGLNEGDQVQLIDFVKMSGVQ